MPLGKRSLSCLCLIGYLGIAPETLAKPLSSHPYRKQATRPLPPAVAPKFRKVWRSHIQQSALPPARPHLSQQGRAKPATVGSALPRVVWQIKEILPATSTRRQRVIWQVHSLAETQPGYVVTASRSHSIPRQRPPLMRPAISRSPASAVSPATATTTTAAYRRTPNASPARQPAAPVLINYLAHQGQQWLNQWGEAEISLQGSRTDRLQGSAALLLPLKQTQQQQLFTQGGWYRDQEGALFSLGLGQRYYS